MADLGRDFWIRETGTRQQLTQLRDRYDDDDDDDEGLKYCPMAPPFQHYNKTLFPLKDAGFATQLKNPLLCSNASSHGDSSLFLLYAHRTYIQPTSARECFIIQSLLCLCYHKVHYIQLQTARLLASQD